MRSVAIVAMMCDTVWPQASEVRSALPAEDY